MIFAEEFEENSAAPIEKRRFFKPGFAVEARSDPIAGFGHVAGDPGVAGFVWANEADDVEVGKVADVERKDDEDGPGDALGEGGVNRLLDVRAQMVLSAPQIIARSSK